MWHLHLGPSQSQAAMAVTSLTVALGPLQCQPTRCDRYKPARHDVTVTNPPGTMCHMALLHCDIAQIDGLKFVPSSSSSIGRRLPMACLHTCLYTRLYTYIHICFVGNRPLLSVQQHKRICDRGERSAHASAAPTPSSRSITYASTCLMYFW